MLANGIDSSRVTDYVNDLLTINGRVWLEERTAGPGDVGREPSQLEDGGIALRVFRGDRTLGFRDPNVRIEAGDQLLVLSPRALGSSRGV